MKHKENSIQTKVARYKKNIILLFFLTLISMPSFSQFDNPAILWNTSFVSAQETAQRTNKLLFLFFEDTTPNAITLSLLQNTFTNSDVVRVINNQFVPVRIRNNAQLTSTFNVIRYPTVMIVSSNGKNVLGNLSGIISTENIMTLLLRTHSLIAAQQNNQQQTTSNTYFNPSTSNNNPSTNNQTSSSTIPNSTNNNTVINNTMTDESSVSGFDGNKYVYSNGSFERIDENRWIHKTPFYTVNYKVFSDSKFFFYLENETRDTFVAIPKSQNNSLWIWKDNVWHRIAVK